MVYNRAADLQDQGLGYTMTKVLRQKLAINLIIDWDVYVIFKAQMPNICLFQLLNYKDLLHFSILYHCKLNICGFWTVSRKKIRPLLSRAYWGYSHLNAFKKQKTVLYLMTSLTVISSVISFAWIHLLSHSSPRHFPFLSSFCFGASWSPTHFHFRHCPNRKETMMTTVTTAALKIIPTQKSKKELYRRIQIPAFSSVPLQPPVSWNVWPLDSMIHIAHGPDIAFLKFLRSVCWNKTMERLH